MWKFLKYWTGLSLMANMPFILPFAGVLHSLFGDNRERPLPKTMKPKAPLKEFTTRTEPGPEINWARVYRRIACRKTDVTAQKVGRQEYALAPKQRFDRTAHTASQVREPSPPVCDGAHKQRRKGMTR